MSPEEAPGETTHRRRDWRRIGVRVLLAGIAALVVAQAIPYGHSHGNPPVTSPAHWTDPGAKRLFAAACGDCHSHETTWPWYSNVAPVSWLVANDIQGGRDHLNLSAWHTRRQPELSRVVDAIGSGEMPPLQYKVIHKASRLSDAQRAKLIQGFRDLYRSDPPATGGGGGG